MKTHKEPKPRPIRRSGSKGFSLLELLVVVAIILIIAAIAIPNLLRARTTTNQAAAVSNLRTMYTAENQFQDEWGAGFQPLSGLADSALQTPASCTSPNLLPLKTLGVETPVYQGYTFTFAAAGNAVTLSDTQTTEGCNAGTTGFSITATPQDANARGYYIDNTGVTHFCLATGATPCVSVATDPVIGQ